MDAQSVAITVGSSSLVLKADGTILEIEKTIPLDKLPKAVKQAIAARYPHAKIEKVEEVTKGEDGPVRYEVVVATEVVLSAKGQFIDNDDDDDEDEHPAKREKGEKRDKD